MSVDYDAVLTWISAVIIKICSERMKVVRHEHASLNVYGGPHPCSPALPPDAILMRATYRQVRLRSVLRSGAPQTF